ncbi:hypothetical protein GY45DRAFT_1170009 [Cubamyces sp. BRFM 1775]|nr:hypothetical protein GY45DRAFT_1170009 [Cubamyces sp. BRFM 1775]
MRMTRLRLCICRPRLSVLTWDAHSASARPNSRTCGAQSAPHAHVPSPSGSVSCFLDVSADKACGCWKCPSGLARALFALNHPYFDVSDMRNVPYRRITASIRAGHAVPECDGTNRRATRGCVFVVVQW